MLEKLLKRKTVYVIVSTCYSESDSLTNDNDILKRNGLYLCTGMNVYASKEEALEDIHEYVQHISDTYENVVVTKKDYADVIVKYEETLCKSKFRIEYAVIETSIK